MILFLFFLLVVVVRPDFSPEKNLEEKDDTLFPISPIVFLSKILM